MAVGTDDFGRRGPGIQGYTHTAARRQNAGRVDPNNIDPSELVPSSEFLSIV